MRRSTRVVVVGLAAGLTGCGELRDSYGKEYVIYDSRKERAGTAAPADAESAPASRPAPAIEPTPAVSTQAPATAASATPEFARILLLEQVQGEIERAILDGQDGEGTLARKRREVEAELRRRITEAGPALADWRKARAAELREFTTR